MLQVVPTVRAEGQVVDGRGVPDPGGGDEKDQRRQRVGQATKEPAQRRRGQPGGYPEDAHGPRQAPEQGEQGCAQPEERRRRHHEQQVLHHVDLEQQLGERLDRRGQGQVDGREPAEERGGAAAVPAPGVAAAEHEPAAQIDAGREQQSGQKPGVERPGAQAGVERGAHGYSFSSVRASAGRARGAPSGRRFSRNSTRPVISGGLICLPYAGMSPPPGVPLLTWSINWSRVRRVPTAVRSGPRRPPLPSRAWQLRQLLLWNSAAPWSRNGVLSRTRRSGTGSPLQAVIFGDQGDVAPWYVSTPRA